jgi:hypothetical protein
MSKAKKLVVFILLVSIVAIFLIVYRYEKKLLDQEREHKESISMTGGTKIKKEYSAQEVIDLIKNSPDYLGDSITIFENGEIISSNGKFNGTLHAVTTSEDNMSIVKNLTKSNKLPLHYNIYNTAAAFYKQQYPEDFESVKTVSPSDSIKQ